jgi:hypothetical protein
MLTGLGHVIAGLSIRQRATPEIAPAVQSPPLQIDSKGADTARIGSQSTVGTANDTPASVTENTTNILHRDASWPSSDTGQAGGFRS